MSEPNDAPSGFRKKPVVIEAMRLSREDANEALAWIGRDNDGHAELIYGPMADWLGIAIFTLEGTMEASPGDWIIRGVKGEFYPCKPDIFDATYEAEEALAAVGGDDPSRAECETKLAETLRALLVAQFDADRSLDLARGSARALLESLYTKDTE